MARGRSLVGEICKNFINSLKPKNLWGELKGRDNFGTEYYEITNTSAKRSSRWFVPRDGQSHDVEKPPEWETWLRHGRGDPPTEEEIQLNMIKRITAAEKGKKLEKPKTKDLNELKAQPKSTFPVYEDYQLDPSKEEKTKDP